MFTPMSFIAQRISFMDPPATVRTQTDSAHVTAPTRNPADTAPVPTRALAETAPVPTHNPTDTVLTRTPADTVPITADGFDRSRTVSDLREVCI